MTQIMVRFPSGRCMPLKLFDVSDSRFKVLCRLSGIKTNDEYNQKLGILKRKVNGESVLCFWDLLEILTPIKECNKCSKEYWCAFEELYFDILIFNSLSKMSHDFKLNNLLKYHEESHLRNGQSDGISHNTKATQLA